MERDFFTEITLSSDFVVSSAGLSGWDRVMDLYMLPEWLSRTSYLVCSETLCRCSMRGSMILRLEHLGAQSNATSTAKMLHRTKVGETYTDTAVPMFYFCP